MKDVKSLYNFEVRLSNGSKLETTMFIVHDDDIPEDLLESIVEKKATHWMEANVKLSYKKIEKNEKKAQKHLSRKTKGSNSFERQRRKTARLHEKITNSRMDNLHKVSHQLVSDYDIIALEDLNVKGMVKNHKLAKHISDASWGTFVRLLEYKADWNDKQIVEINRFYPSSKTCCECGWINQDLNLSIREWTCKNGHVLDRDLNAAKNILKEGLKIISSGTGDYTDGDVVRSSNTQLSAKSEAYLSLANG